jgi:hypothetical protein
MGTIGDFIDDPENLDSIEYLQPKLIQLNDLKSILLDYRQHIEDRLAHIDENMFLFFKVTEDDVNYLKTYTECFNNLEKYSYRYALAFLFSRLFLQETGDLYFYDMKSGYEENTFEECLNWFKRAGKRSIDTHTFVTNSMNWINAINLVYIGAKDDSISKKHKKEKFGEFYKYLKSINPNFSKMQGYYITENTSQPIMLTNGGFNMTPFVTQFNKAKQLIRRYQ